MSENNKKLTFKEVDGNAIDEFFNSKGSAVFMHGANCQKIMGAGIAAEVRERIAPLFYLDQYDTRTPSQRFGSYSAVVLNQDENNIKLGVNLYTQFDGGANFKLSAFRNALEGFVLSIPKKVREDITVYLPKIGTGIGGGNWQNIERTAKELLSEFNVVVVNFITKEKAKTEEKK